MLKAISYRNISDNAGLFFGQFQLRHREFFERQHYAVREIDRMEFDQYDSLAAVYLVYSDDGKTVLGCSRLTPINYGCMLKDHFADWVDDPSLFDAPDVWEGTRFCIDNRLSPDVRAKICRRICLGYLEFGLASGIQRIVGLMPTFILRSVFERSGIVLDRLGPVKGVGSHSKIQAASIAVNADQRDRVVRTTGIPTALHLDVPVVQRHAA